MLHFRFIYLLAVINSYEALPSTWVPEKVIKIIIGVKLLTDHLDQKLIAFYYVKHSTT